jgi:hypothetical protein
MRKQQIERFGIRQNQMICGCQGDIRRPTVFADPPAQSAKRVAEVNFQMGRKSGVTQT